MREKVNDQTTPPPGLVGFVDFFLCSPKILPNGPKQILYIVENYFLIRGNKKNKKNWLHEGALRGYSRYHYILINQYI